MNEQVRMALDAAVQRLSELRRHPLVGRTKDWAMAQLRPPASPSAPSSQAGPPAKKIVENALFSSFESPWLSSIAFKGSREPFQLLPSVEHHLDGVVTTKLDFLPKGATLEAMRARDPHPLPVAADREGYHNKNHYDWWLSGLSDYHRVRSAAELAGAPLKPGSRVFELGCASGRVLRHFACQGDSFDVWGADIKRRHAEWVTANLPGSIRMLHNTIYPHLPVEDGSVDLLCAFSVFTHIDDLEMAWIAEIRRILKKGGIAYLTVCTEHHWKAMGPGWPSYDALLNLKDHIVDFQVTPELLKGPMAPGRTVFWWDLVNVYNSIVFHSTDYLKKQWGRYLTIREIIPQGHFHQDVVVLQKE
jgi:SAM-dependent methyltransferase